MRKNIGIIKAARLKINKAKKAFNAVSRISETTMHEYGYKPSLRNRAIFLKHFIKHRTTKNAELSEKRAVINSVRKRFPKR